MKKSITRRLTTALLAAAMCVSMAACGSKTDDTKTDGTGDADGAKKYTIGVCQLMTHDALDAATQGFIDAVKDKLGEENVTNDVAAVTTKAAADSDVIYIPTDNTAASCTETIGSIVLNAKTPVVAGEKGLCTGCGSWVWVWRTASPPRWAPSPADSVRRCRCCWPPCRSPSCCWTSTPLPWIPRRPSGSWTSRTAWSGRTT